MRDGIKNLIIFVIISRALQSLQLGKGFQKVGELVVEFVIFIQIIFLILPLREEVEKKLPELAEIMESERSEETEETEMDEVRRMQEQFLLDSLKDKLNEKAEETGCVVENVKIEENVIVLEVRKTHQNGVEEDISKGIKNTYAKVLDMDKEKIIIEGAK